MPLSEMTQPDTISLWTRNGRDSYGKPIWNAPSLISGHWEDKQELITNKDMQEVISDSRVHVDTDLTIGDFLFLGTYSSGDIDPTVKSGASEIINVRKIRSILHELTYSEIIAYL